MKTHALLLGLALLGGAACATAPTQAPGDVSFAAETLDTTSGRESEMASVSADPDPARLPASPPAGLGPRDELRGILELPEAELERLRAIAADDGALTRMLTQTLTAAEFATLAWLRSPDVEAARARVAAARTGFAQSEDLADLVAALRSFVVDTMTRVGPERSRRGIGTVAPYPNLQALSSELVSRTVALAEEDLREVVLDVVIQALHVHADSAWFVRKRELLVSDLALTSSLLEATRSRLEAGSASQSAVFAFEARVAALESDLQTLAHDQTVLESRWNRLLRRGDGGAVNIGVNEMEPSSSAPSLGPLVELAKEESQGLRRARLRVERSRLAVRLAETMTLPRMDLGSSRFEREQVGEAGAVHGDVFPSPGGVKRPPLDFGVRAAQVEELRARESAAVAALVVTQDELLVQLNRAIRDVEAAALDLRLHDQKLVALAERRLEAERRGFEAGRSGYVAMLDAARDLLAARLGRNDAQRALHHAHHRLIRTVGVRPR